MTHAATAYRVYRTRGVVCTARDAPLSERGTGTMDTVTTITELDDEPVGIVIAGGGLPEAPPRLWAYVWGQDDEPQPTSSHFSHTSLQG
jgi:hypothetical protein